MKIRPRVAMPQVPRKSLWTTVPCKTCGSHDLLSLKSSDPDSTSQFMVCGNCGKEFEITGSERMAGKTLEMAWNEANARKRRKS